MENKKELGTWLDNFGLDHPLVIAGPCSAETEEQVLNTAGPGNQKAELAPSSEAKSQKDQSNEEPIDQKSQSETLVEASAAGSAFCEECEKAKS